MNGEATTGGAAPGREAPDFSLPATGGRTVRLAELRGAPVVLYFYPKDNTPGCTAEGRDFRDQYDAFRALNVEIFGVSRDGLRAHENFKAKQAFPFDLLSDAEERACRLFGVLQPKKLYGRAYIGVERSTFLIDKEGVLRREWRGVKVPGHVAEVLEAARAL